MPPSVTWRRVLPLTFVVLSLFALVLLPVIVRQRTNRIRAEMRAAIEPARDATEDAARVLSEQLSLVIAYQTTEQTHFVRSYRTLVAGQDQTYRRLDLLTPHLGSVVQSKFRAFREAEAQWHRGVEEAELMQLPLPAPVFLQRVFEINPRFNRAQQAARELEHAVRMESQDRQRAITAAENVNATISIVLTILALAAALIVAWIGRQMRLLAIAAERGREDSEREAARATEARKAAEDAHERATFLSEASRELSLSLEMQSILPRVAALAVPLLGDICFIATAADGRTLERSAFAHRNVSKRKFLDQIGDRCAYTQLPEYTSALASDHPTVIPAISEAMRSAIGGGDERLAKILDARSILIAPLAARGRTFGAITFVQAESRRQFSEEDVALAWEFSRRVALTADNVRLYEEAQQALRSREEILAIVSHDLRSPLTTISMTASLLQKSPPEPEEINSHMDVVRTSAKRMTRLINDLLDVTRLDAGHKLPIEAAELDVAPIVEEVVHIFTPQAEAKSVFFQVENRLDGARIRGDRDRLVQALSNLIGNALKFTPGGGRVNLEVTKEDRAIHFAISDTGPGIPRENLSRIWDPYWQMNRTARMGAGLGLAIVKGIIDAHGGRIWVDSAPEEGSTFHFSIPAAN